MSANYPQIRTSRYGFRPARCGSPRRVARALLIVATPAFGGCAPTLDLGGVYFPAWLVSSVVGLVAAYAAVWWLGRRPGQRTLAQSGLLFCSLGVTLGLLNWWIFFSGF
ncbi:MAG: hypothetical protein JRG76_09980 [Deltaproteobacteria bacterium]|nr:hypothetical protein [Deltaproteobacteria bacterium]